MVDPERFGEQHDAVWKTGETLEETSRIAAAFVQHQAAIEVREYLDEHGTSAESFADRLGQNAQMLRRKLDGDYPALPEDIMVWAISLRKIEVVYAPSSVDDLLPPTRRGRHAGL